MAAFDGLMKASFGPIHFPVESLSVDGTQRHHMHEFPHTDGGKLERLGRRPYSVKVTPVFDESIFLYDKLNGAPLYPDTLVGLHVMFEQKTIADLVIPTMGRISAFMTSFRRSMIATLRSGERVDVEFVEVMNDRFRLAGALREGDASPAKKLKLVLDLAKIRAIESQEKKRVEDNLFDKIEDAVNDVLALRDQVGLYAMRAEAKIRKVTNLLAEADRTLQSLQHPENWQLVEAMKELYVATRQVGRTLYEAVDPGVYELQRYMTIQQVSMAIFETTTRSFELLQMNEIENADVIPPYTKIRYVRGGSGRG